MLSAAGVSSFAGMDEIVKARLDGKPAARLALYRRISPATFGIGIGGFLSLFFRGL